MALQTFSAGAFIAWPDVAEWDGDNHAEIVAWINHLDGVTDPALAWRATAVTDETLTLFKPREPDDPMWPDRELKMGRGEWVCLMPPEQVVGNGRLIVQTLHPAGKWKTTDRHGIPASVDDIIGGSSDG